MIPQASAIDTAKRIPTLRRLASNAVVAITALFDWLGAATQCLRVFWVQIGVSAFSCAVLAFPDQTLELYRTFAEDIWLPIIEGQDAYWRQPEFWRSLPAPIIGLASLLAMAASLAYSARVVGIVWSRENVLPSRFWRAVYRWFPIVIGAAPIGFAAWGLWSVSGINADIKPDELVAQVQAFGAKAKDHADYLQAMVDWIQRSGTSLRYVALLLVIILISFFFVAGRLYTRDLSGLGFYRFTRRPVSIVVSAAVLVLIITFFVFFPVEPARLLGPIAIFALFVSCLSVLAGQFVVWSHQYRIPIIALLVGCVLFFSLFDLNDNHELRRVDSSGAPVKLTPENAKITDALPEVGDQFRKWYAHRPDKDEARYAARYPVYIVAAQGGGIYAAAQTLLFLTKMQMTCEAFTQHLFAISSVSGGSVGAALFSAFADGFRKEKLDCPPVSERGNDVPDHLKNTFAAAFTAAGDDYLSPLMGAMLFPDFAQRFLWFEVPSWSRARALEQALETSWQRAAVSFGVSSGKNQMQRGVLQSWQADGVRPAIIFNTTETGSGRRRVIAPFKFRDKRQSKLENDMRFLPLAENYDLPLSTAAVASARFPWLTPAGWFWDSGAVPSRFRVVDGGYFENSGVATAMDLIQHLTANVGDLPVEYHLIVITSGGFSEHTFSGLSELFAPVRSLLNTSRARTYTTIDHAYRQLGTITSKSRLAGVAEVEVRRLQTVRISDFLTPLPLGWRLSVSSLSQIERRAGLLSHCYPDENFEQQSKIAAFGTPDCVKLLTYHQLRGDSLPEALIEARERYGPTP